MKKEYNCAYCQKKVIKYTSETKKYKNVFCSSSCNGKFNGLKKHEISSITWKCDQCGKEIIKTKRALKYSISKKLFCNPQCASKTLKENRKNKTKIITLPCKQCSKPVSRKQYKIKNKSNGMFCNRSCAGIYTSRHINRSGHNISKLELYLQKELIRIYPNLIFHFNQKNTILAELDIYIPKLKLAFEINGIFHYEPIFGTEKLNKTINNDERKFQACLERGIELCIINSSKIRNFKESTAKPYLDIISNIINKKIEAGFPASTCDLQSNGLTI